MPSRRRYNKKRTYRTKRRLKRKMPLTRNVPNAMSPFRQKIQCYVSLNIPAGTEPYNYRNSYPLNFPGRYTNNSGSYGPIIDDASTNRYTAVTRSLANLMDMFDQYRVKSLTVDYVPVVSQVVGGAVPNNFNGLSNAVNYVKDFDDVSLFADVQEALVSGKKPLSATRRFKIKMRQLPQNRNRWINCQDVSITPTTPITANTLMFENTYSSIKMLIANLLPDTTNLSTLGRLYLTWDVEFKGINTRLSPI